MRAMRKEKAGCLFIHCLQNTKVGLGTGKLQHVMSSIARVKLPSKEQPTTINQQSVLYFQVNTKWTSLSPR